MIIDRRSLLAGFSLLALPANSIAAPDPVVEPPLYGGDYAAARKSFRTKLLARGPAPDDYDPWVTPDGAATIAYRSGDLELKAWVSHSALGPQRRPAVLFLHGGNSLGDGHWELMAPYIAAGYAVMVPAVRAENGLPGAFSGFYDEAEDALAAADHLASMPGVDAGRMFLAGHSVGGTLTHLVAMMSPRFRAAVPMSGNPNAWRFFSHYPEDVRFDAHDPAEFAMRSAVCYPGAYKCPVHLLHASEETGQEPANRLLIGRAKAAGIEIGMDVLDGDHNSALPGEIGWSIGWFGKMV